MFLLLSSILGCAPVFFAELTGYVLDNETSEGIPGVDISLYTNEPRSYDDESFLYRTSTDPDGKFQQPLIWDEYLPKYWTNGDVISLYFTIQHPDYKSKTKEATGIVSGVTNTLPTTFLQSLEAKVENLRGSVYTSLGPVNGVQIALYAEEEEEVPILRTESRNINGLDGQYLFESVEWFDQFLTGELNITVKVEDLRYVNSSPSEISEILYHNQTPPLLPEFIVEERRPLIFQSTVTGYVAYLIEEEFGAYIEPIAGAEILFEWFYDDQNQSVPTSASVRSDATGTYVADIIWQDDVQDYSIGVPFGEDQLEVDVTFPNGGPNERPYNLSQYTDTFTIRSWTSNTLPDAYEISIYVPPPED